LERPGREDENPQRVIVPNDNDDDFCEQDLNIVWTSLRVLGVSNYLC